MATAGPTWARVSKPETNSPMMRKTRQASPAIVEVSPATGEARRRRSSSVSPRSVDGFRSGLSTIQERFGVFTEDGEKPRVILVVLTVEGRFRLPDIHKLLEIGACAFQIAELS